MGARLVDTEEVAGSNPASPTKVSEPARCGHRGECRTAAALADRRARLTERRREKTFVTPEARSRWNRTYKLKLMGLTPERFAQMLETQGYACAMCRTPFEEDPSWLRGPLNRPGGTGSCGFSLQV